MDQETPLVPRVLQSTAMARTIHFHRIEKLLSAMSVSQPASVSIHSRCSKIVSTQRLHSIQPTTQLWLVRYSPYPTLSVWQTPSNSPEFEVNFVDAISIARQQYILTFSLVAIRQHSSCSYLLSEFFRVFGRILPSQYFMIWVVRKTKFQTNVYCENKIDEKFHQM